MVDKTSEIVREKLETSVLLPLIKDFANRVSMYPAAMVIDNKTKPKRENAINKASESLYKFHTVFSTPLNNYTSSVLLISNDIAVSFMIEEAAEFSFLLEEFYIGIKPSNSVQELQHYYKQFNLKSKQILDGLLSDLEKYSELYGFELDKRIVVEKFKDKVRNLKENNKKPA